MNRENKRKQYEKGYYKTHPCNESFVCKNCGREVVPEGAGSQHRNHCPNCLYSLHVANSRRHIVMDFSLSERTMARTL
jgi:DNA-directed RNA polymerase subunit RPC12/RpoP